jgi:hypothetical protein
MKQDGNNDDIVEYSLKEESHFCDTDKLVEEEYDVN